MVIKSLYKTAPQFTRSGWKGFGLPVALCMTLLAAACAPRDYPKERVGTLLGAVGGAYAGTHFGSGKGRLVATALGTLIGAGLGAEIGRSLDRADILYMERSQQLTLERYPTGIAGAWSNPVSGNYGTVTPLNSFYASLGRPCREFRMTAAVSGRNDEIYGVACRDGGGTWSIVSR